MVGVKHADVIALLNARVVDVRWTALEDGATVTEFNLVLSTSSRGLVSMWHKASYFLNLWTKLSLAHLDQGLPKLTYPSTDEQSMDVVNAFLRQAIASPVEWSVPVDADTVMFKQSTGQDATKATLKQDVSANAVQAEYGALRAKLASQAARHTGDDVLRDNDQTQREVQTLQSQLVRAQDATLVSAKVIDARLAFRCGQAFVEYELKVETHNRGTLFVWHRYSTFRSLVATMKTQNKHRGKPAPDLPTTFYVNKYSDTLVQKRMENLNVFLDAAAKADHLQFGIRIHDNLVVYKRRRPSLSRIEPVAPRGFDLRSSTASTVASAADLSALRDSTRA